MRCSYLNFDILIKDVVKKGAKKIVTSLHERNCSVYLNLTFF